MSGIAEKSAHVSLDLIDLELTNALNESYISVNAIPSLDLSLLPAFLPPSDPLPAVQHLI